MADTEPDKRWYDRFFDDGSTELSGGDPGRVYYEQLRGGAKAVGSAANALVNGAYSTLDNTYDAVRAVGRGVGVLGPEEFRRFGQEADVIGASLGQVGPALGQIVKHPTLAARAAGRVLAENPLLPFYLAGRGGMAVVTGLGPVAMAGGALRAVENGHNLIDSIVHGGLVGTRAPGGLLGIPPEGRGLLASHRRSHGSVTSTKLAQLLESSRWAPYKMGTLASLPVAAALMLFWIYYPIVAVAFSCLYMFWGLDVFNKTPLRKMIAWALFLGTALAFGIWYYLIFYPRIGLP